MSLKWDSRFMDVARVTAGWSKDPSTKVGAVIVGVDGEVLSGGYNGMPRGVDDDVAERWERPEKYEWIVHAELNAILNAARIGVVAKGATMYTLETPCSRCALAIVQAGIARVVVPKTWLDYGWRDEGQVGARRSRQVLFEGGVDIVELGKGEYTRGHP